MNWKKIEYCSFAIAGAAIITVMALLQILASTGANSFDSVLRPNHHQFGAVVFYVDNITERWINGLWIAAGAFFSGGAAIALMRGNITGRKS